MAGKYKKEIREWLVLIFIFALFYLTGWHKPIISKIQGLILETGMISPDTAGDYGYLNYNFALKNADGKRVAFDTFENKVVFVNLWATWCPPCVAELKDIQELYEKMGTNIHFVMLSLDKDEGKAVEFVTKRGFNFPVYHPAGDLPEEFRSPTIPTTFVIDKDGQIVVKNKGMAKYDSSDFRSFLESLL